MSRIRFTGDLGRPAGEAATTHQLFGRLVCIDVDGVVQHIDLVGAAKLFRLAELDVGVLYHPFARSEEAAASPGGGANKSASPL